MKNNIFNYATGELSQDAFICWLINWINFEQEDKYLHATAKLLLDSFFVNSGKATPSEYKSILIKQQFERIDILLVVNGSTVIIIEDKVDTENHSGQLQRYVQAVENKKGGSDIPEDFDLITIYLKTGNQSRFHDVLQKGYIPFDRKDFLNALKTYSANISNQIFNDYLDYLQNIENQTESYLSKKINEWSWWAWQGFLMNLFEYVTEGSPKEWENWKYIINPRGGFWGLFWRWMKIEPGVWIYLQIELEMGESVRKWLCFKVYVENKERRSEIREKLFNITQQLGKYDKQKNRPNFRSGEYMTFWIQSKDIFSNGDELINLQDIKDKIDISEKLLKKIAGIYAA